MLIKIKINFGRQIILFKKLAYSNSNTVMIWQMPQNTHIHHTHTLTHSHTPLSSTFNCHPPFLLPHLGQLFQRIIFPLQFSSLSHFSMHLGVKKQISSQVTILAIVLMSHNSKGKKTCTLCNQLLKILKVAYNPFQIVCGSFHVSF